MAGLDDLSSDSLASCGRLEAYSDAIFSIIATVMILPIAHTEVEADTDLSIFLTNMSLKLFVYFACFLIVTSIWSAHCGLFETMEKTDEVIVLLNLALMMATTFLPFTFTLMGNFGQEPLSIYLLASAVLLVQIMQIGFIFYTFRTPAILKIEVRVSEYKNRRRNLMYFNAAMPGVICLLSLILTPISVIAGSLCLFCVSISAFLKKWLLVCFRFVYSRARQPSEGDMSPVPASAIRPNFRILLEDTTSKERIIAFTDGVFAIVATLIILDICEQSIPSADDVRSHGGLAAALAEHDQMFLAYAGTFVTVGMLWYVHHSLLHHIKEMNKLMCFFNNLCLACIGLSPIGFKLTSLYALHEMFNNEIVAIHLSCSIIFLASLLQCAVWVTGLCYPQRHITSEGNFGGRYHAYVTAKLIVYPVISLFIYFLSFASFKFTVRALNGMQIGTPFLFMLLHIGFTKIPQCISRRRSRPYGNELHVQPQDDDIMPVINTAPELPIYTGD